MTDILVQPLQITHDRIDNSILETVRKIDEVAAKHNTRYFLAGATAREVMLHHVFGRRPGRRTLDVDFGIAVRDWDHFNELKAALVERSGFTPVQGKVQRLVSDSNPPVIVDLIPFGGIEAADNTIAWPPERDIVMRVVGFNEALETAVLVSLDERLVIRVVCLPALVILKLIAWKDRRLENNRDATDIFTLLKEYGDSGNEDRLYGQEVRVLEAEGYDFEMAGARLIGLDAARIVSETTKQQVAEVLQSEQLLDHLVRDVVLTSGRTDSGHTQRCELLVTRFRDGFLERG